MLGVLATLALACGDGDAVVADAAVHDAQTADAGRDASAPSSTKDAEPIGEDEDDAGRASIDGPAGSTDAGTDAGPPPLKCSDGEMPCDDDCIDEIAPTLEQVHQRIFARSCALSTSCHTGSAAKEGLDLGTVESTLTFVGQESAQQPSLSIIEAGQPGESYLVKKLRGTDIAEKSSTGAAATQMPPPPSRPLCDAKIDVIEAWIAAGAKND